MKFSKKNKILVFGIVLMLFFSYKLAIQKTIEVSNTYHSNLDKKERIKDLPKQLSFLKQKERYLDSELGSLNIDHSSIQNSLLKFLNNEAIRTHRPTLLEKSRRSGRNARVQGLG